MLHDPVTAKYKHSLTTNLKEGEQYQCIVANTKPSEATASLIIQGRAIISHEVNTTIGSISSFSKIAL